MGRNIADTKYMKDFSNYNLFELMEVPIDKLKELSIEDFAEEINGKKVNIHPFTEGKRLDVNGNIYISAKNVNVFVKEDSDGYRINIWGDSTAYSQLSINLSEHFIFGIYSYGNDKNYRIAFEGNSPDLLVTVVSGRLNKEDNDKVAEILRESEE